MQSMLQSILPAGYNRYTYVAAKATTMRGKRERPRVGLAVVVMSTVYNPYKKPPMNTISVVQTLRYAPHLRQV